MPAQVVLAGPGGVGGAGRPGGALAVPADPGARWSRWCRPTRRRRGALAVQAGPAAARPPTVRRGVLAVALAPRRGPLAVPLGGRASAGREARRWAASEWAGPTRPSPIAARSAAVECRAASAAAGAAGRLRRRRAAAASAAGAAEAASVAAGGGGGRGGGGRRSDMRLKHDIVLLGRLDDGLGYYRFVYNGGHTTYVGVMAQEVRTVMPEAVMRGADGYMRVSYDLLDCRSRPTSSGSRPARICRVRHGPALMAVPLSCLAAWALANAGGG